MKLRHLLPLALCGLFAAPLHAHDADAEMTAAAINFLSSLTPEQKARVTFDFPNDERKNWHYIPRERKGLPIKDMAPEQRLLAQALLASGLSSRGYEKAVSIMSLDAVLKELEKGKTGPVRDPDNYYFSIFGTPGGKDPWGWRFEGHHISRHFTMVGEQVSMTPFFVGAWPTATNAGLRAMDREEQAARELVTSLEGANRETAIFRPRTLTNHVTQNQPFVSPLEPVGLPVGELNDDRKALVLEIIQNYLGGLPAATATPLFDRLSAAGIENVRFGWAGSVEPRRPHYYRLQGPTFLLEFDNSRNSGTHIHSVWRDFAEDFGQHLVG